MAKRELFSSRWALLLATIGMAIGAGNIWRFPRLAGQYGGSFLIPWLIFLFIWSIPLIIVEFSLGRHTRRGVVGAFADFMGEKYTWMGGFVAFCTTAIMFYYSVVSGWALKYFFASISGNLKGIDHTAYWDQFTVSYQPLMFHFCALAFGSFIIYHGIVRGIERANKILLPSLLFLLILGMIRALTLPNANIGLNYFFAIRMEQLLDYRIWLEGLSQSAWSTGAGWGLILTYAVYMRKREDVVLNSFITGFGNNSASLIAGLAIVPAIFSLSSSIPAAEQALRVGNNGLSFIIIPQLYSKMPAATFFTSVFFLALFFAAISSLISMLELATRIMIDFGLSRKKALPIVSIITAIMGIPSAIYFMFFKNQDWVWGLGLIISGLFFAILIIQFGVEKFRKEIVFTQFSGNFFKRWFEWTLKFVIPIEAVILLGWWLFLSVNWNPSGWYNPFNAESLGTCLFQWAAVIFILLITNRLIYNRLAESRVKE